MKHFLLFLSAMMLLCTDADAITKYVTANLNLRTGPGTSYSIATTIPKGTSIEIDEDCSCTWIPVRYLGNVGYVCAKYISDTPVAQPQSPVRYYTNTYGNRVQSPTRYSSRPNGATALCRDGTYSFSQSRRGTCSHHGGVSRWY